MAQEPDAAPIHTMSFTANHPLLPRRLIVARDCAFSSTLPPSAALTSLSSIPARRCKDGTVNAYSWSTIVFRFDLRVGRGTADSRLDIAAPAATRIGGPACERSALTKEAYPIDGSAFDSLSAWTYISNLTIKK